MSKSEQPKSGHVKFVAVSANAPETKVKQGRRGWLKEQEEIDRVKEVFQSGPITFVSRFSGDMANDFAKGEIVDLPDGEGICSETPHVLLCVACKRYHGQPTKEDPKPTKKNLWQNAIFHTNSGKYFAMSQTCMAKYLLPVAKAEGQGDIRKAINGLAVFNNHYHEKPLVKSFDNDLAKEYRTLERK